MTEESTRVCRECGAEKPVGEFYLKDGRRLWCCTSCLGEARRQAYARRRKNVGLVYHQKTKVIDGQKRCSDCGETKPVDRFGKNQHGNPTSMCKACQASTSLARYIQKQGEAGRAYAPRLVEAASDGYRTCRQCGEVHPATREYFTGYHGKKEDGLGVCRSCLNAQRRKSSALCRLQALAYYSKGEMRCSCCGERHIEFLEIDHIEGGGRQHLLQLKKQGFSSLYSWLRSEGFPVGFRVLCISCNSSLGRYGYCPHERERANMASIREQAAEEISGGGAE